MIKTTKRNIILVLLCIVFLCVASLTLIYTSAIKFASAETVITMIEGADLRLSDNSGLRFGAMIEGKDADAEYHIVIVPSAYLSDYTEGDKIEYLNGVIAGINESKSLNIKLNDQVCLPFEKDGKTCIRASITNVLYSNANRNFTAFAYADKGGVKTYSLNDTARSLSETAVNALANGETGSVIEDYVVRGMKKTLGLNENDSLPNLTMKPEKGIVRLVLDGNGDGSQAFSCSVLNSSTSETISSLSDFVYAKTGSSGFAYKDGNIIAEDITGRSAATFTFTTAGENISDGTTYVETIDGVEDYNIFDEIYSSGNFSWVAQANNVTLTRGYDAESGGLIVRRLTDNTANASQFTSANNRVYFRDITPFKVAYESGYDCYEFEYKSTLSAGTGSYYGFRVYSATIDNSHLSEIVTYMGNGLVSGAWTKCFIKLGDWLENVNAETLSIVVCGNAGSDIIFRDGNFGVYEKTENNPFCEDAVSNNAWAQVNNGQSTMSYDYGEGAVKVFTESGKSATDITSGNRHNALIISKKYFEDAYAAGYDIFTFEVKGNSTFVETANSGLAIYSHKSSSASDKRNNEGAIYAKSYAYGKKLGSELSSSKYTKVTVSLSNLLSRDGMDYVGLWFGGADADSVIYLRNGKFGIAETVSDNIFCKNAVDNAWAKVYGGLTAISFDENDDYGEGAVKISTPSGQSAVDVTSGERHRALIISKEYFEAAYAAGYDVFTFEVKGNSTFVAAANSGFAIYSHKSGKTAGETDTRNNESGIYARSYAYGKKLGSEISSTKYTTVTISLYSLLSRADMDYVGLWFGGADADSVIYLRNGRFGLSKNTAKNIFCEDSVDYSWIKVNNGQSTISYDDGESAVKIFTESDKSATNITSGDRHMALIISKKYFGDAYAAGYDVFTFEVKGNSTFVEAANSGLAIYSHKSNSASDKRNNETAIYAKSYTYGKTLGSEISSTEYTTVTISLSDLLSRDGMDYVGLWFGGADADSVIYLRNGTFEKS